MASIKILDIEKFVKGLLPVTSTEISTKTGEYNDDGLFSERIFGIEGSLDRQKKFSYINLNAKVIHPAVYRLIIRLDRKLEKMFSTENSFSLDANGNLIIDDGGTTGLTAFIDFFPKINFRGDTPVREKIIDLLKISYRNNLLFVDKLPIIPPDFRPSYVDEKGRRVDDELNNIYINIMKKTFQIRSAGTSGALYDLLNYGLQIAINDHDTYVRKRVSKKNGLIRANMLGKRVDYCGRAVITPGPELNIGQVGLPLRMAVSLFEPFLKHYFLFSGKFPYKDELEKGIKDYLGMELSVDSIVRLVKSIKGGDVIPSDLKKLLFDSCEIVMKGRIILAKRDPALHSGSYRAFEPVLIDGNVVQLSTSEVGSFNADFDGDQMAFYHPLSTQAQVEAKEKMTKTAGNTQSNSIIFEISKEMCAGLYTMSKNITTKASPIAVTKDDLAKATNPYIPVRYRGKNTTMGKAIINSAFPSDFKWIEGPVTKKIINSYSYEVSNKYGEDVAKDVFSRITQIGFKFATIISPTITLDMLEIPPKIMKMKSQLDKVSTGEADKILKEMEKLLIEHLKDTGLYDLIESGAGKGWDQPRQILIAKGVIADPKGNLLAPIKGSFSEGLRTTEFFNAASGARKGMADRALNTAETGYFTRQLVYFLSPVEVDPFIKDCNTKRTIPLRLTEDLKKRLIGRYITTASDQVIEFIPSKYKSGHTINLRTPILCESVKVCHTCYGDLVKRHKTPYVGVLAASSIGERGTQLIMRTFHTGGAATIVKKDALNDLVENDPLVDIDKNKLEKYIIQSNDHVIAKQDCKLTIDLTNYKIGDTIQINEKKIWVKSLLLQAEFPDLIMSFILDYNIEINKIENTQITKEYIIIEYKKGDVIFGIPLVVEDIKAAVSYVNRIIGGKEIYSSPAHLLQKIFRVYGPISNMDLVHLEVLVSQCFRDRTNPELPARLGKPWNPIMANLKNNIFSSGFIQGLAFENVNKAVESGLISDKTLERSIMERILTGDIIQK